MCFAVAGTVAYKVQSWYKLTGLGVSEGVPREDDNILDLQCS